MKITITGSNISNYREVVSLGHVDKSVTEIKWEAGPLDGSILAMFPFLIKLDCSNNQLTTLAGLEHCTQLQNFNCFHNRLTSLEGIEHCVQLKIIDCQHTELTTLEGINYCIQLEELNCSYNKLTTLTGIEYCTQLQKLYCDHNQLATLTGLENLIQLHVFMCECNKLLSLVGINNCRQLQELGCTHNQLTSLMGLENCVRLQILYCSYNQLTSLIGLEHCAQLQELGCYNNSLTSLTGIEHCTQLRELYCYNNSLTSLTEIVYLHNLIDLDYSDNPLDIQTIQVQRFLSGLGDRNINGNNSIYSDEQNVHDLTVQKTVCISVQNLLKDPSYDFPIETIIRSSINEKTKRLLIEYCEDETEHSHHLITYKELLSYVWSRIIRSDHVSELFKILEEQIQDSERKCFTGRFNRTLSVLVGFYEDIQIEISDSSRIGAIILAIKNRVIPYDSTEHRERSRKQLLEAGYTEVDIEPWLGAIE